MNNLVKFRLHGNLGKSCGEEWDLEVSSVADGIRWIEGINHKLYKFLLDKSNENIRYRIIINGKDFYTDNEPRLDDLDSIYNCELRMKKDNLQTVDIIPVLEGAGKIGNIFTAILGIIMITVGVLIAIGTLGGSAALSAALIVGGLGLLAAGVTGLLTKPPKFEDFREIDQGGKVSYLFNGPENVANEGGPVPTLFGKLLIGSQVISAAYAIRDFESGNPSKILTDKYLYPQPIN